MMSHPPPVLIVNQFTPAHAVLAYCAFSGRPLANVAFLTTRHPAWATGDLPNLVDDNAVVSGGGEETIINYLKSKYSNIDAGLSRDTLAQLEAFSSLIRNDLADALDLVRFDDDEHYRSRTKRELNAVIPFPLNRYMTWRIKRRAEDRIEARREEWGNTPTQRIKRAQERSRRAYASFETKLSLGSYVLGTSSPTSVDALLYGHLASAYGHPVLLEMVANEFPNILNFYHRVAERVLASPFVLRDASLMSVPSSLEHVVAPPSTFKRAAVVESFGTSGANASTAKSDEDAREEGKSGKAKKTQEEIDFERGSRNAIVIGSLALFAYLLWTARLVVVVVEDDATPGDGGSSAPVVVAE